jgi:hypothetical protein
VFEVVLLSKKSSELSVVTLNTASFNWDKC